MSAPFWMGEPPEVHSTLLSNGPGPGPLLASAEAWTSLGVAYTDAADELSATVATVLASAWRGCSAESYAAANAPYIAWLLQSAADCTAMAAHQRHASAAYTSALAAMPTLTELAANHAVHGLLTATNFFGINTIPIALNEADYARMWVQAATTMTTYQAVSSAAVAAAPQANPAPQIAKSAATGPTPPLPSWLTELLHELGYVPPTKVPLPPNPNQYPTLGVDFWTSIQNSITIGDAEYTTFPGETLGQEVGQQLFYFYYTTTTLLPNELSGIAHGNLSQIFSLNSVAVLFSYVIMRIDNIGAVINYLALNPAYLAPVLPIAAASLPGTSLFANFAGLADLAQQAAAAPAAVPPGHGPALVSSMPPLPNVAAAIQSPLPAPSAFPSAAVTLAPIAPPPAGIPPPPSVGPESFPYLVNTPEARDHIASPAASEEPLYRAGSRAPAVAVASSAPFRARAQRRRPSKAMRLGRRYEYMDQASEPADAVDASDRGAGSFGFAGTESLDKAEAAGLAVLESDSIGSEVRVPMVPRSWQTTKGHN
jgi:PPE-repeat protein